MNANDTMDWNFIDALLITLVLLSVLRGWYQGLILGLLGLLRLIGSFLLALRFYQSAAQLLGQFVNWPEAWIAPAAFLLIFLLAGLAINLLGYALIRRLPQRVHERRTNRLLGLVPGFVRGVINATIAAALLMTLPLTGGVQERVRESNTANALAGYAERAEAALRPVFGAAVDRTLNTLTVRPDSQERVDLPFTVRDAPPAPELERRMLQLVNEERAKAGLRPLAPDPELREVARRHSADMLERGYFAHVTPEGKTPFDRISEAGVRYLTAGENLALAPTLPLAHTGLMNSPGHRANILRPQFGRAGIGILDGGRRGLMVTQLFRN